MPDLNPETPLYPLKFLPRLFPRMWGGRQLESALGKRLPPNQSIGESWELYDFPPGIVDSSRDWLSAEVAEGALAGRTLHELMLAMPKRLLGHARPVETSAGLQFPVLIKFLDAQQDLSVQVHPDERYAAAHSGAQLKNEAWYVLDSKPGARLLKGVRAGVGRREFEQALADGTVERLLVSVSARRGDVHYLPSGTVHALGAGMLVAEIQTPSDTTFRVYDYGRVDPATGRPRQLHVAEALEVIDFSLSSGATHRLGDEGPDLHEAHKLVSGDADGGAAEDGLLVAAPQFVLSKWSAHEGMRAPLAAGAASVLIIIAGQGGVIGEDFEEVKFAKGEVLLIPADLVGQQLDPESDCAWLEVTFPR